MRKVIRILTLATFLTISVLILIACSEELKTVTSQFEVTGKNQTFYVGENYQIQVQSEDVKALVASNNYFLFESETNSKFDGEYFEEAGYGRYYINHEALLTQGNWIVKIGGYLITIETLNSQDIKILVTKSSYAISREADRIGAIILWLLC